MEAEELRNIGYLKLYALHTEEAAPPRVPTMSSADQLMPGPPSHQLVLISFGHNDRPPFNDREESHSLIFTEGSHKE